MISLSLSFEVRANVSDEGALSGASEWCAPSALSVRDLAVDGPRLVALCDSSASGGQEVVDVDMASGKWARWQLPTEVFPFQALAAGDGNLWLFTERDVIAMRRPE